MNEILVACRTVRLPRKVGLGAAAEWTFTGEIYSAADAKEVGLVHKIMPPAVSGLSVLSLPRCLSVSLSLFFDCPLSSSGLKKFAECDGTLSQELMDHVRGVADVISARAPLAVRAAKRAMVQGEPTACVRYTRAVLPRLGGIR